MIKSRIFGNRLIGYGRWREDGVRNNPEASNMHRCIYTGVLQHRENIGREPSGQWSEVVPGYAPISRRGCQKQLAEGQTT